MNCSRGGSLAKRGFSRFLDGVFEWFLQLSRLAGAFFDLRVGKGKWRYRAQETKCEKALARFSVERALYLHGTRPGGGTHWLRSRFVARFGGLVPGKLKVNWILQVGVERGCGARVV